MSPRKESKLRTSTPVKFLIGLLSVILIVLMFPQGESIESEVSVGSIWTHDDLIASMSFPVLKDPEVYQSQLKVAAQSVDPVFVRSDDAEKIAEDSLKSYNNFLLRIIDSVISNDSLKNLNPTFLTTTSFDLFKSLRRQERNMVAAKKVNLKKLFVYTRTVLDNLYKNQIINLKDGQLSKDSISIRIGNIDRVEKLSNVLDPDDAKSRIEDILSSGSYTDDIQSALDEYISHFIFPNLIYKPDLTKEEIDQAKSNVSKYSGIVNENERIIGKHERVTKEAKLKIESYKIAKGEKLGGEGFTLQFLGKFLHIAFLLALITIYLFLFRKKIYRDNLMVSLLAMNFVFIAFVTFLINQIAVNAPLQFMIFIPASAMLLTIIFDSRIGFYSTVIMVLIAGALRGNDYTFAAMNLFAGALSVYSVRDIKNRSQIFRSFVFILIGYVVTILAFGFERFATFETIMIEAAFAGSNALISPVLTYGLLIFFERIFKITTDLTLLELSNFDHPLLKDLSRRAPGTFNHSTTVGTLAEAAAEDIGANSLLARVGAYYHDIGKTIAPQDFIENQLNNRNLHENITPEESVALIMKHVKVGIELAEEYKLPQEIIDFIPMHHGTTTVSFFYEKAKKLYGEEKVNVQDYKYPGPKPNSRETAIVMLADGCESSVRSIEDADPVKIEHLIGKIFSSRLDEGQLDDSPITLRDITKIKESFTGILLGQHHKRIRYPKQDEAEKGESLPKKDEEDKKDKT
jgi:cyclic-di-AMP phosphodiesterase PgpH